MNAQSNVNMNLPDSEISLNLVLSFGGGKSFRIMQEINGKLIHQIENTNSIATLPMNPMCAFIYI